MESNVENFVKSKIYGNCLFVLLAWLSSCFCHAGNTRSVAVILSDNHGYYQQCAKVLIETLEDNQDKVEFKSYIYKLDQLKNGETLPVNLDVVVAVGSDATDFAIASGINTPLLNVLLPRQSYLELIKNLDQSKRKKISAIFIDQPHRRIVALAKALPIKVDVIGAITSAANTENAKGLGKILAAEHIHFNYQALTDNQNPVQALKPLFAESDAFIALPDKAIFNRALAKWILSLSIRQKVPVIGFSRAYTEAGALVSIFSTPDDIGRYAGELLVDQHNGVLQGNSQTLFPKYFTIESNSAIARALGIESTKIERQYLMEKVLVQEAGNGEILD